MAGSKRNRPGKGGRVVSGVRVGEEGHLEFDGKVALNRSPLASVPLSADVLPPSAAPSTTVPALEARMATQNCLETGPMLLTSDPFPHCCYCLKSPFLVNLAELMTGSLCLVFPSAFVREALGSYDFDFGV